MEPHIIFRVLLKNFVIFCYFMFFCVSVPDLQGLATEARPTFEPPLRERRVRARGLHEVALDMKRLPALEAANAVGGSLKHVGAPFTGEVWHELKNCVCSLGTH